MENRTELSPAIGPASDPMVPAVFRIARVRRETHDTFTLDLTPPASMGGFRFKPGQFNMLYVFGVGEVAISISGDPARPDVLTHTVRAVGVVTRAMQKLRVGDVVGVRGPFGAGWPVDRMVGSDIVVVAGGIGLAPLRPAIYEILANRERFGTFVLLCGTRTPADLLYTKELERWRSRFDLQVYVTVDHADASWRGNVGVVTTLVKRARFDPNQTVAMMCGPEVMMRFAAIELRTRGLQDDNVYVTMERNMKCAVGLCGHCQFGPTFICKDGPVFASTEIQHWFGRREI